ncbi:pantoate--beta-alanine ligase [Emticicia sp. BO119]|uniref:pantoate--beta-alanine ligase n=1 Tax=Emticicia sp. BO119 TaxID=2757768 RepID=UPI0015F0766B|nr:pantoate--beta-alanine ligase [Emticicia sp. BO119]MBA4848836.1 pantoate--beta-alanine ligase [Emticicia sp. BO119]
MQIFYAIAEAQEYLKTQQKAGKTIGFVPTMGALHAGHISLIESSRKDNDLTVCSIFVNPTQFNNPEDLKKYPRTLEKDCELLEAAQCDVVFAPTAEEMYPALPKLKFDFGTLETVMEGKFRPGHFNGVGIVVSKLFHIVKPDKAYFGLKDLQQVAVIRQMVSDLSFDLTIVPCPTLREADGLAMSSRNMRLSAEARALAPHIHQLLELAKDKLLNRESSAHTQAFAEDYFRKYPEFELEYLEIADFDTLEPISQVNVPGKTAICMAAFLGGVRLIDNIVF